jgi:error-prone DNA polymerase
MTAYAELQAVSNFSFLRGASHAEELVEQARQLGLSALAITDHNSLAGIVRAHAAAKDAGLQFIPGARLDLEEGFSLLCWPETREAYGRLSSLITEGQRRAAKGKAILRLADLEAHAKDNRFALLAPDTWPGDAHEAHLKSLIAVLPRRPYLAASLLYAGRDRARLNRLDTLSRRYKAPLLASNAVLYHHPARRILQDVLTCIREKCTLPQAGFRLQANAERHLKTPDEMARIFAGHPHALKATLEVAEACSFSLDELRYEYPDEPVPEGIDAQTHLKNLTRDGAAARFPQGVPPRVQAMIDKELTLIAKLKYAPYFLTVHDIVAFARGRGILCQGRGSAANSAVCFCLGITSVNPAEADLLFERFISEERKEPPDIDVDFEHERREEVIQYLYERYGRDRAGLAGTVISYRGRSAMRDVGKAMGLSEDVTSTLAGLVWGQMEESLTRERIREKGLDPDDPHLIRVLKLAGEVTGFPRHLSQHVGGFVLTRGPLREMVPIGNAAMEERTFIEWDKDDIDTLGILKVDVLALGMLTCIRKCFEMIEGWHGIRYDLASVPREDPAVYDMLCRADSIGVFQVESRAQMNMLPRLKPRCFYDLVIEVAIVRPGPIQGDMVHPYLRRRNGLEPEEYPSPDPRFGPPDELKRILHKTRGVPLFQEQAMRIAMVAAEFTPGELNELRKALATFRNRGTIEKLQAKMVDRMVARGYERAFAEHCFSQIKGFGEYGFPESHAASFALLVYVSAWLKCHHPAVFAACLLNSQPMGFYAPAQIIGDARAHGVHVEAPDVNLSQWDSILEPAPDGAPGIRLGLREVDGLRQVDAALLLAKRPYARIADIVRRAEVPVPALERLAAADAFRSMGLDRRAALWQVKALAQTKPLPLFAAADMDGDGFEPEVTLPRMPDSEQVVNDYQTLKLSLKGHPMQFLRAMCAEKGITTCSDMAARKHMAQIQIAGLVLVRQRPGSAKGVVFITLEDETGVCNAVVWPDRLEAFRAAVMGGRLLQIAGRIERHEGVTHLIASHIIDRTGWLALLSEEGQALSTLARADEVKRPGPPVARAPAARHPRNVRVIPKSRDFH